jgi:acyl-CoA thioester hydrolase
MPHPEPYEIAVAIRAEDVDGDGGTEHVNNITYLRWVQEVAIAHWQAVAPEDARRAIAWVVLRHEIDYLHPARPADTVRARTWVGAAKAIRFERHTEIVRQGDGVMLARARSIWCPVDSATGRPVRVPAELRPLFSVE